VADAATAQDATAPDQPKEKGQLVPGPPIWYPLALIALLLAIAETALAHRFSQSK